MEHVSDVSEGIMVHDLAHPPRIHPPFEDVIRLKHDTITHDQNTLRVAAAVSDFAVRFFRKSDPSWLSLVGTASTPDNHHNQHTTAPASPDRAEPILEAVTKQDSAP